MINKYLKSLLAENKRVIIPDFGGFVVKRSASGDIISFNSFLKFNDDLLADAVMAGEGVDKIQAMKVINDFVADLGAELDSSGRYEIAKVGYLVKDKKGNIRYMEAEEMAPLAPVVDTGDKDDSVEDTSKKDEEIDDASVSSSGEGNDEELEVEQKIKDSNELENPLEDEKDSITHHEVNDVEGMQKDTLSNEASVVVDEELAKKEEKEATKKGAAIWWVIIILIFVAIAGWSLKDNFKEGTGKAQQTEMVDSLDSAQKESSNIVDKRDALIQKKADKAMGVKVAEDNQGLWQRIANFFSRLFSKKENSSEEKVEATAPVVKNEMKSVMAPLQVDTVSGILVVADKYISKKGAERYNVIIGSFSEEVNAEMFNQTLINNGLASEIFDRYNGFKAVSYGSYPSLDIALRVCGDNIELTPDIWVLVK